MYIPKGKIIDGGIYNVTVLNDGVIKGGEFLGEVKNLLGNIEGGVFKGAVINGRSSIIDGGEFYNALSNYNYIKNATLKSGASLTNQFYAMINKLTIDGTVKLDDYAINSVVSIDMMPNSVLELSSIPDFRKFINREKIKIGNSFILKDGTYENHDTINNGDFKIPIVNAKEGIINGGNFESLENHGTINNATLAKNDYSVETFKNDGIINGGMLLAKNTYNSGIIKKGSFSGTVHNENGSILGGMFDRVELLSGDIQNAEILQELTIKGGSVGHINLRGGFERLLKGGFPKIKNEAGVMIEKLDIWGKVKFNASELDNIESVELLQANGYGGTILYLDALPDFSKITGHGTIKVGNASYKVDGSIISWQEDAASDFLVNDSFKLYLAAEKLKEQKYLLDEGNAQNTQNAQNNLQNDLQVDLLAAGQNGDNFVIWIF